MKQDWGKRILGVHLEGPLLHPASKGAHPIQHILKEPDLELFRKMLEWSRLDPAREGSHTVIWVTLDPGRDTPDMAISRFLSDNGVVVSMGHHQSTPEHFSNLVRIARSTGVTVTHVPNAWPKPVDLTKSPVFDAILESGVPIQQIVDGRHVTDENVRYTLAMAGAGRYIVTADESPLLFAEPGVYTLFDGLRVDLRTPDNPPAEKPDWPKNDGFPHSWPLSGSTVSIKGQVQRFADLSEASIPTLQRVGRTNALDLMRTPLKRLAREIPELE
jgi:N-acetylglucosamine-6-phosphate deacetylase